MFRSSRFNFQLIVLLVVSIGLTACGGGGGGTTGPVSNKTAVNYPDCASGNAAYSGCWTTENCIAGAHTATGTINPNYSSKTLIQFHELTSKPDVTGVYDMYGMVWGNSTCSGTPIDVQRVNPFNKLTYIQKADQVCVDTGGTTLAPASDCYHVAITLTDNNNVAHPDAISIYNFVTDSGIRLCNNQGQSIDNSDTFTQPNEVDIRNNACLDKFDPLQQ